MIRLFALALLTFACGAPPPPSHVSIDDEMPAAYRLVVEDSLESWCRAVGWCPELVMWSERGRVIWSDSYGSMGRDPDSAGCNDRQNVHLNPSRLAQYGLDMAWAVITHELGHFGIDGHTPGWGTMGETLDPERLPLEVDDDAKREWHDQQG